METIDALFNGHGEQPVNLQDSIMIKGNDFLEQRFPGLDTIVVTRVSRR